MQKLILIVLFAVSTAHGSESRLFESIMDERLMLNVKKLGVLENGLEIFAWQWNKTAQSIDRRYGLPPSDGGYAPIGLTAQSLRRVYPDSIVKGLDGYLRIDSERLAMNDQFMRWKITADSMSVTGRCAKVLETRYTICF
jgi:hypothetical protein